MIFVTLGTQDKTFPRLLEAVEKLNTEEKIVAQIGSTEFKSKKMEIHKFMKPEEFNECMEKADVIISHAGVGTILQGIQMGKKMIIAARLKKYGEHVNDHQLQILETFSNEGFILPLNDFDELESLLEKEFTPNKFVSNKEKFNDRLEKEINTSKKKRK